MSSVGYGLLLLSYLTKNVLLFRGLSALGLTGLVIWCQLALTDDQKWQPLSWNGCFAFINLCYLIWEVKNHRKNNVAKNEIPK